MSGPSMARAGSQVVSGLTEDLDLLERPVPPLQALQGRQNPVGGRLFLIPQPLSLGGVSGRPHLGRERHSHDGARRLPLALD